MKSSILYKGNGLRLTISACYLWEMTLMDILLNNMKEWKGIREKAGEVNITKAYITNGEASRTILDKLYISFR
jgi:hypothetical protein